MSETRAPGISRAPSFIPALNPLIRRLIGVGLPFGPNVLLTVRERSSGVPHTFPVAVIELDGRRYVQSPFGRSTGRAICAQPAWRSSRRVATSRQSTRSKSRRRPAARSFATRWPHTCARDSSHRCSDGSSTSEPNRPSRTASPRRANIRCSSCACGRTSNGMIMETGAFTPQQAVRTMWSARQQARAGSGLRPRLHIRRAESRRRWVQEPPRLPEAPTYRRI